MGHLLSADYIRSLSDAILKESSENLFLTLNFCGENTLYTRCNHSKIRQQSTVHQLGVNIQVFCRPESSNPQSFVGSTHCFLSGDLKEDLKRSQKLIHEVRNIVVKGPAEKYLSPPTMKSESFLDLVEEGHDLFELNSLEKLFSYVSDTDFVGIVTSGSMVRAHASSLGSFHYFRSHGTCVDYSLYLTGKEKAVKRLYYTDVLSSEKLMAEMEKAKSFLKPLNKESVTVPRGKYKVFLEPIAFADLMDMFSWEALSEKAISEKKGPFHAIREPERTLPKFSSKFHLLEDFNKAKIPMFNELGELAPIKLDLIKDGTLQNSLVSSKSAKEYNIPTNYADFTEEMRSPKVKTGNLQEKDILSELDHGLYISNLHYLNWSDHQKGRVTGMTRFACFKVENGKLVAPIHNMRFDDSLFNLLGENNVVDFTSHRAFIPNIYSYKFRRAGGLHVPGVLLNEMEFTL